MDVWLAKRFTYRSRSQWAAAVRSGEIFVDGRSVRPSATLRSGSVVSFAPAERSEPPVDADFAVVFEDADLLVVDKPGNLPCHPGGAYFANTLWGLLRERFGEVRIVNRLDRETSGLVVVAKNAETAGKLAGGGGGTFAEKRYLAVVHGSFPDKEIIADGFIRDRKPEEAVGEGLVRKKRVFSTTAENGFDWERAATTFRLTGRSAPRDGGGDVSLVEAELDTGRTHQIRATLLALGYPIVGDKIYGLDETVFVRFAEGRMTEDDRARLVTPRQALHCAGLSFTHPESERPVSLSSPLPADLAVYFDPFEK